MHISRRLIAIYLSLSLSLATLAATTQPVCHKVEPFVFALFAVLMSLSFQCNFKSGCKFLTHNNQSHSLSLFLHLHLSLPHSHRFHSFSPHEHILAHARRVEECKWGGIRDREREKQSLWEEEIESEKKKRKLYNCLEGCRSAHLTMSVCLMAFWSKVESSGVFKPPQNNNFQMQLIQYTTASFGLCVRHHYQFICG